MPYFGRAFVALLSGTLYLVLIFVMGWKVESLFFSWLFFSFIAFIVVAVLCTVFPFNKHWFYPLIFASPSLVIGFIALADNFTFLTIGFSALCAGGGGEYIVRRRAKG